MKNLSKYISSESLFNSHKSIKEDIFNDVTKGEPQVDLVGTMFDQQWKITSVKHFVLELTGNGSYCVIMLTSLIKFCTEHGFKTVNLMSAPGLCINAYPDSIDGDGIKINVITQGSKNTFATFDYHSKKIQNLELYFDNVYEVTLNPNKNLKHQTFDKFNIHAKRIAFQGYGNFPVCKNSSIECDEFRIIQSIDEKTYDILKYLDKKIKNKAEFENNYAGLKTKDMQWNLIVTKGSGQKSISLEV